MHGSYFTWWSFLTLNSCKQCSTAQLFSQLHSALLPAASSCQQLPAARSSCVTLGSTASFRTFRSSFALVSFGPFGSSRTLTYGHVSPPGDLSDLGNVLRFGRGHSFPCLKSPDPLELPGLDFQTAVQFVKQLQWQQRQHGQAGLIMLFCHSVPSSRSSDKGTFQQKKMLATEENVGQLPNLMQVLLQRNQEDPQLTSLKEFSFGSNQRGPACQSLTSSKTSTECLRFACKDRFRFFFPIITYGSARKTK